MRPWYILLVPALLVSATAGGVEDYLGAIGPFGTISGANYSEYGRGFQEFVAGSPGERDLSAYPGYLADFLERDSGLARANYSHYSPAFEEFMKITAGWRQNLSAYPEGLRRFLNESESPLRTDLSQYSPAVEEFMDPASGIRRGAAEF